MYWFLALVLKEDVASGALWPSYILCQARTTSSKRTGYRVVKQIAGEPTKNIPKVLVTELTGHDDLINFLSIYQANDAKGVHYHPIGSLFWFECNQYGEPTGHTVYVRNVPIRELMWKFAKKKEYRTALMSKEPTVIEILTQDKKTEMLSCTEVKPKLYQAGQKERKKKNGNSKARSK